MNVIIHKPKEVWVGIDQVKLSVYFFFLFIFSLISLFVTICISKFRKNLTNQKTKIERYIFQLAKKNK